MSESALKLHSRELDLAKRLKEIDFPWDVLTGDWFYAEDAVHIVMHAEKQGDEVMLQGRIGKVYEKSKVIWLPHRTTCIQWLNSNDWEFDVNLESDAACGVAHRRKTGYKIEKKEPTELAVLYALILEIQELTYFGWA